MAKLRIMRNPCGRVASAWCEARELRWMRNWQNLAPVRVRDLRAGPQLLSRGWSSRARKFLARSDNRAG
jgi:hypothetical protein